MVRYTALHCTLYTVHCTLLQLCGEGVCKPHMLVGCKDCVEAGAGEWPVIHTAAVRGGEEEVEAGRPAGQAGLLQGAE